MALYNLVEFNDLEKKTRLFIEFLMKKHFILNLTIDLRETYGSHSFFDIRSLCGGGSESVYESTLIA